ncbi:MAG: hypothetical protein EBT86_13625, partial [Actinobacteria bacterium]|nr:hypothetical protein [Actinomycetota bacterium]
LVGHEKLPTLRRQLRDRHPRKDHVVVEQHPQEDHLERLRHPRGGEHHEPVAEDGNNGHESTADRDNPGPGVESTRERALTKKVNACIFLLTSPARGMSP